MYAYSPIKTIHIKNFRNIGEATLEFNGSPIISLIGENEAGKTSVVKAFSVCAVHSTPRDQKDYIRDGTSGFGVEIGLEDGTEVTRIKTSTLNRYHVKKADGTEWDTTKIEGGLPPIVQQVMGLIEEPETKEYLQIRTYEDPLLFVVTPASTNYKVMYGALKVEQLTKGIKAGSKEANTLKSTIDSNEVGIETLTSNMRSIRVADITPLITIRQRLNKELSELAKLERAISIADQIQQAKNELGILSLLVESGVEQINEADSLRLHNISEILKRLRKLEEYKRTISPLDTLEPLDEKVLNKLGAVIDRQSALYHLESQSSTLQHITSCEDIQEALVIALLRGISLTWTINAQTQRLNILQTEGIEPIEQSELTSITKLERISALTERTTQLEDASTKISSYIDQVNTYMKNIGAIVENCPKCGEMVLIDADKYT